MIDDLHFIDLTVAGLTTDPTVDVHRMIEVSVVRKPMHLIPLHGRSTHPTGADLSQLGALRLDPQVAIHAGLRRRNVRVRSLIDVRVTVFTGQAQLADVKLV